MRLFMLLQKIGSRFHQRSLSEKDMKKEEMDRMKLEFDEFEKPGLYLIFSDGSMLPLAKENIEGAVKTYWEDPSDISDWKAGLQYGRVPVSFRENSQNKGRCLSIG
jgi:hypothetical protein